MVESCSRSQATALVEQPPGVPPQLIARIVDVLHPEQVWLFGSRARGEARVDSDWDFMAVLPDDAPDQGRLPASRRRGGDRVAIHADDFAPVPRSTRAALMGVPAEISKNLTRRGDRVHVECMAMLAAPDVPLISEPMTWADICTTYPDQHVGLSEVVTDGERWWRILSAHVFCHGEYGTVLAQVGTGPGRPCPDSRHAWTGKPYDGEAHLAFKLAMNRRTLR